MNTMNEKKKNPLLVYADWVSNRPMKWPESALHLAKRAFIDTLGCAIPGAHEPVCQKLWSVVQHLGSGSCSVIGLSAALSPVYAAMFNGTAAHALDFDDDFDPAKGHPSAAIIPAILALAELRQAKGSELLDAYIVGLQIMGLMGQALNPFHRRRGWHATSTIGTLAATAACARLLKLDANKTAHAISMSTSMAGGFMSQFGSDTKPMHAGFAAASGVQAALFAEAGLTAGSNTLDAVDGMNTLMVGQDIDELRAYMADKDEYGQKVEFKTDNLDEFLFIEEYPVKVKRFPICGSVHRSLDGLLNLKEQHGFAATDIERIHVKAPIAHLKNMKYNDPKTPQQARFSLEYGLALGALFGDVTLSDFTKESVQREKVRALFPLTEKEAVNKLESECPTEVTVRLKNGKQYQTQVSMAVGSGAFPLSDEQIQQKFIACMKASQDSCYQEKNSKILAILWALEERDNLIELWLLIAKE